MYDQKKKKNEAKDIARVVRACMIGRERFERVKIAFDRTASEIRFISDCFRSSSSDLERRAHAEAPACNLDHVSAYRERTRKRH